MRNTTQFQLRRQGWFLFRRQYSLVTSLSATQLKRKNAKFVLLAGA
jgi:hypothetical protein